MEFGRGEGGRGGEGGGGEKGSGYGRFSCFFGCDVLCFLA